MRLLITQMLHNRHREGDKPERIFILVQFNSVEEGNAGIIATARTIKAVIENPFLAVLELDSHVTQTTRHIRSACFRHNPAPPGPKPFVKHLITDVKVNMFFGGRFSWRLPRLGEEVISSSLEKVRRPGFGVPGVIHILFSVQD
jgi:hypothetical protein